MEISVTALIKAPRLNLSPAFANNNNTLMIRVLKYNVKKVFSLSYELIFQLNTYCTPSTPWLISQPPEWIWRCLHCCLHCYTQKQTGAASVRWGKVYFMLFTLMSSYNFIPFNSYTPPAWGLVHQPPEWIFRHCHFSPCTNNRDCNHKVKIFSVFPLMLSFLFFN